MSELQLFTSVVHLTCCIMALCNAAFCYLFPLHTHEHSWVDVPVLQILIIWEPILCILYLQLQLISGGWNKETTEPFWDSVTYCSVWRCQWWWWWQPRWRFRWETQWIISLQILQGEEQMWCLQLHGGNLLCYILLLSKEVCHPWQEHPPSSIPEEEDDLVCVPDPWYSLSVALCWQHNWCVQQVEWDKDIMSGQEVYQHWPLPSS